MLQSTMRRTVPILIASPGLARQDDYLLRAGRGMRDGYDEEFRMVEHAVPDSTAAAFDASAL